MVLEVVGLQIGDDAVAPRQRQEGAVALVGLCHQQIAGAEACPGGVGADFEDTPADHCGGVESGSAEDVRDQRSGGGLACVADSDHLFSSTAEVDGCTIESNTADEEGGGIHVRFSDPIISSTSVIGNIATITGGGINFFDSPDAWLSNSVLCENMPNAVEGIYSDGGGNSMSDSCTVCEGDVNGDDVVNVTDLLAVVGNWGPCEGCNVDINNDGFVNVTDLLIVVGNWGSCL